MGFVTSYLYYFTTYPFFSTLLFFLELSCWLCIKNFREHTHITFYLLYFFSSFFFPICCQQPWFLHLSSLSLLVVRVSCQFLVSCHCIIIALCNLHFYSSPCFPGDEQGCYPACMHQGAPVCSSVVSLHFAS